MRKKNRQTIGTQAFKTDIENVCMIRIVIRASIHLYVPVWVTKEQEKEVTGAGTVCVCVCLQYPRT